MKINLLFLTFLLFSVKAVAQFNTDNFVNIDMQLSSKEIIKLFPSEKWEEKKSERGKSISYYSWLEPNSIKVSFSFDIQDQMKMKSISNGKRDEESAQKFFTQFKEIGLNLFGKEFELKNIFGTEIIIWKNNSTKDILLTLKDERAVLIVAKKGTIPMI
ncbi:MAG: hypothetical protein FJ214_03485 [Ignavibacteria bacterium]|nr:hypothetical protein [Ignavibacteria bacterium]